ncbi:aromatic acid/H+ symport family MFS transporter [Paraburkholderia caribensis]|nr:MFS transporter [Paraburkholderia caribensis]PTB26273.1 aromatic acid/H+ symport family MFS transporter [Paraburkholderia caribensis]
MSRTQLLVVVLCALIAIIDGFDVQIMGFVAPTLIHDLGVSRGALGPVFSAGIVGMMAGSLMCGLLADRIGRRKVLIGCMVWAAIWSFATAFVNSIEALLALRFLTGIGLGGAMPNATALTSEYTPRRLRATCVMLMYGGFSIGAAAGGGIVAALLTNFTWRAVFLLGGAMPVVLAIGLICALPESIRFMVVRGWAREKVIAGLKRIDPLFIVSDGTRFSVAEEHVLAQPVKQLFTHGRTRATLLTWLMFGMGYLDLYFLNSWLPTIIHDSGVDLHSAVLVTALFQLGGTIGTLILGRLIDHHPPAAVLGCAFLVGSVSVFVIGGVGASFALLSATVFCAGLCIVGGLIGLTAVTAELYPTGIRSTGIGWAIGIGRIGGISGPVLGGMLLSLSWQAEEIFRSAAVPALITAIAACGLAATNRRKATENDEAPAIGQNAHGN